MMRKAAVALIWLVAAPAAAQDFRLPDRFLGHWETEAKNCELAEPTDGLALEFTREPELDRMSFWDWSTEGGSCDIIATDLALPLTAVYANCAFEEFEKEATTFYLTTLSGGRLAHDGFIYHRCAQD